MDKKETLKKVGTYILGGLFWFAVGITFIGGCVNTFFKSVDEPNNDYEEYIHSTIP